MSTAVPAPPATGPGGRLDQRLDVAGRDEVGRMAGALNTVLDRLIGALGGISANVTTVASFSAELTAVAGQMTSSARRPPRTRARAAVCRRRRPTRRAWAWMNGRRASLPATS